jgi:group I intron endonuclease
MNSESSLSKKRTKWNDWNPLSQWDKLPRASGIYEILNSLRGVSYIGSAVDLKRRGHYKSLKSGKSHNRAMQDDFIKDGENHFKFRIIDFCEEETCVQIEQARIDERDFSQLYNVAPIAGSTLGYQFSEEQTQALRKNRKGVPLSLEAKQNRWRQRKEREWKANRYEELLSIHIKSETYADQRKEILDFLTQNISDEDNSHQNTEFNKFTKWWLSLSGKELSNDKYDINDHEWSFISQSNESIKISSFENLILISKIEEIADLILEKIFNYHIKNSIEVEYINALKENPSDFVYKPFHFDFLMLEGAGEWSRAVGKYNDGSIESLSIIVGNTAKTQEWYPNGKPRLALIQDFQTSNYEKRIWHDNGRPECMFSFLNGKLHGAVKKWNNEGYIYFDAIYEDGILIDKIELSRSNENYQLDEILPKPSIHEVSGVSITLGA